MKSWITVIIVVAILLPTVSVAESDTFWYEQYQAEASGERAGSTLPPFMTIENSLDVCGYLSVSGDSISIILDLGVDSGVVSVVAYWSKTVNSDVYDQYAPFSPNGGVMTYRGGGVWVSSEPHVIRNLEDGLYRIRAVITASDGAVTEDFNHDGKFDDFTFDAQRKPYHILMRVDRSVTSVAFSSALATIEAGTEIAVAVSPKEVCDIQQICYGVIGDNPTPIYDSCLADLTYAFDPVAAGLVTLSRGFWHGRLALEISDPLGNSTQLAAGAELYVLSEELMVVYPEWGPLYGPHHDAEIRARKWSNSSISQVEFFYGNIVGPGTSIGVDDLPDGDEFSIIWDLDAVDNAQVLYVWASYGGGESPRVRLQLVMDGCRCPHQADVDADASITAIDLTACIEVLFSGLEDIQDKYCRSPRFDLDCDRFTSAVDLVILIDHYYFDSDGPCDPCAP